MNAHAKRPHVTTELLICLYRGRVDIRAILRVQGCVQNASSRFNSIIAEVGKTVRKHELRDLNGVREEGKVALDTRRTQKDRGAELNARRLLGFCPIFLGPSSVMGGRGKRRKRPESDCSQILGPQHRNEERTRAGSALGRCLLSRRRTGENCLVTIQRWQLRSLERGKDWKLGGQLRGR